MGNNYKYPRTPHLPWSPGRSSEDDLVLKDTYQFFGKQVIVTEKLDGENTSMYKDYLHARSINFKSHISRDWIKKMHSQLAHLIPEGWRLCGENLYARHSITYTSLESYFYLFSIWNENNVCLDWQQTLEWAELLGLKTPQVLYQGSWDERKITNLAKTLNTNVCEGYVVRTASHFSYHNFGQHVAKWVRKSHVTTDENWIHQAVIPNILKR
ncbi:MAG: RNA ligase family protein [Parachlamydia sp.]|jgi:ATP-dependent RNA circularization protein (DNA/RNA ligase family)|nr:RNA ligase family protein [Parachlamydia sp.]